MGILQFLNMRLVSTNRQSFSSREDLPALEVDLAGRAANMSTGNGRAGRRQTGDSAIRRWYTGGKIA